MLPQLTKPNVSGRNWDAHFRTDHLMADLKGRSVRGGAVTLSAQGAKFILQLGSTMVLARLLTPADFGLVAMVTAVTGFVAMFKDAGLSMATVQREHITHAQVSTLFWVNVALSLAVMVVVAALAPAIAWFYGEPRLLPITLTLAAAFIFGGLTVQHRALLRRQMRFGAVATIDLISLSVGIVAGIVMSLLGCGYWSIVGLTICTNITNCILVWLMSTWRPQRPMHGTGIKPMLAFGGYLTGFSFVNYISRNADNLLIGYYWGSAQLGIYTKAYGLLMLPLQQINSPMLAAIMPMLSRLNADDARYRRAYTKTLGMICLISAPLVAVLIASSDLIIQIVLGPQWMAASHIFAWLGLAGLVQPINNTLGVLLISQGRAKEYFYLGLTNASTTVAVFCFSVSYGATVLAGCYACLVILRTPLTWMWVGRVGPVRASDIVSSVALPSGLGLFTLLQVYWARSLAFIGVPWLDWIAGLTCAALGGALLMFATKKGRELYSNAISTIKLLSPKGFHH